MFVYFQYFQYRYLYLFLGPFLMFCLQKRFPTKMWYTWFKYIFHKNNSKHSIFVLLFLFCVLFILNYISSLGKLRKVYDEQS